MSETTNLKLFKHDNPSTNENQFDVETALNDNWDKIDNYAGDVKDQIILIEDEIVEQEKTLEQIQQEDDQQDKDIESLQTKQTELEAEIQELEKDIQSNAIIEETEQAKSLHIDDASGARGSLNIEGNAEQSESASPSNPAKTKCLKDSTEIKHINKNFLNLSELTAANNNGIDTYSIDNVNQITLKNKLTNTGNTYTYAFQAFKLNLPNGNYNFQAKTQTNSPNYRIIIRGKKNNENVTVVEVVSQSKDNSNFTVDYSQCDEYIVEFYANQSFSTEIATTTYYDIQIEKNSKTDFEEHKEETFNLDIQQDMLKGDYFIKEEDGWKEVHLRSKRDIKDDITNATLSGTNNFIYVSKLLQNTAKLVQNTEDANVISNIAQHESYSNISAGNIDYGIGISKVGSLIIRIKDCTTLEEYKDVLNDDSFYYYYYLATPTKLQCTEAQIEVLEKLSKLRFYKGVNNIFTTEDIALLQAKYSVDLKSKNNKMQQEIDEIKELLSTTQTSAMLLNNLEQDLIEEVK